ncbi:MAG: hypothetical protein IT383_20455 [Deltaproteobacteria bacterium]|nr:hypothetical protein [Deltaproteobacteria bacterium]
MRGLMLIAVLCAAPLAGCAALQPKAPADTCVVEVHYLVGSKVAHVTGSSARIPGLLGSRDIAELQGGDLLWKLGVANVSAGEVKNGTLVLKGLWKVESEPIRDGRIHMPLPIGARDFSYNAACSTDQAALGAFALLQMESEDAMTSAAIEAS